MSDEENEVSAQNKKRRTLTPKQRAILAARARNKQLAASEQAQKSKANPEIQIEEIKDPESLRTWLADKPDDWALVIAFRTVLRVFPLTFGAFTEGEKAPSDALKKALIFTTFRAAILAKAFIDNPDERYKLGLAAAARAANAPYVENAARSAYDAYAARAVHGGDAAIAYAAARAADAADAADAPDAVATAVAAADAAGAVTADIANAADNIWAAINEDVTWFESVAEAQPERPETFVRRALNLPLWSIFMRDQLKMKDDQPIWAARVYQSFRYSGLGKSGGWRLIADWYAAHIDADPRKEVARVFGKGAELEIALQSEGFWRTENEKDIEATLSVIEEIVARHTRENALRAGPDAQFPGGDAARPVGDAAAHKDLLNRKPFAENLGSIIKQVRRDQIEELRELNEERRSKEQTAVLTGDGFAIHLHGPWGAGKTSILYMMQDYLTSIDHGEEECWAVVHFNAWRHERRNPPWWPLIEAVHEAGQRHLRRRKFGRGLANQLWLRWWFSNIWAVAGPYVIAAIIFIVSLLILNAAFETNGVADSFKLVTAAITAFGGFALFGRWFVHGSSKYAERHAEMSQDPLKRVIKLFNDIVKKVGAPVCIFIDDLDRCHTDFVVDLLEGLKSAFRHKDVVYVIAADRDWIRSAFENRYQSFNEHVSRPGQPLGYLFLEKIFQMSIPVPGISNELKSQFVNLKTGRKASDESLPQRQKPASAESKEDVLADIENVGPAGITGDQLKQIVQRNDSPEVKDAAFEKFAGSQEAKAQQAHFLSEYTRYLPDNPRLMVRMVNTFTMRNIVGVLEGDFETSDRTLARWIVLEQRYPAIADILIERPAWVGEIGHETDIQQLQAFIGLSGLREIIGENDADALTPKRVERITRGLRV